MARTVVVTKKTALSTTASGMVEIVKNSTDLTSVNVNVRMTPLDLSGAVPAAIAIGSTAFNSVFGLVPPLFSNTPEATLTVEGIVLQPGYSLFVRGSPYSVRVDGYEYFHTEEDGVFGSIALQDRRANMTANQKIFSTPVDKGAELDEFVVGNGGANATTTEIYINDVTTRAETLLVPARSASGNLAVTRRIPVPPNCDVYVRSAFAFEGYYQWMFSPMGRRVY